MEWPLIAAAVLFLLAYGAPIAFPDEPDWVSRLCAQVVTVTWAVFVLDYVVRLLMSTRRWHFVRTNLLDLAVVVLPFLRPLRLVRLLALLSVLNRTGTRTLRGRVAAYTAMASMLLIIVAALAVTQAERHARGATITNLGDGFWWAITTVTTVGYGDTYPVTITGRFVAAALMIGGVALIGIVTATIASWLVQQVAQVDDADQAASRAQVDELRDEIADLRARLGVPGPQPDADQPPLPG